MSYELINHTVKNHVLVIEFNRPQTLNALNDQITKETTTAIKKAARDPEIRAIVITGSGRGFTSGADLSSGDALKAQSNGKPAGMGDHLAKVYHPLIAAISSIEKPVIAAVNGITAGIGFGIALACDMTIASDRAAFTLVFSNIGLVPDGGVSWMLPRMIGYKKAYELYMTSEKIPADKAHALGFVNQVVPHDQLMEVTMATAEKLASGPTLAFGLTKRAMRQAADQSFGDALKQEVHHQNTAGRSEDAAEGVLAFLQKRPADFKGK